MFTVHLLDVGETAPSLEIHGLNTQNVTDDKEQVCKMRGKPLPVHK